MDPYGVLGLKSGASTDEVKVAFRKLALQLHPDRHAGSPEAERNAAANRFKQITEAYEILSDDQLRAKWQRTNSSAGASSSGYGYAYGYEAPRSRTYGYGPASSSYGSTGPHVRISFWDAMTRGVRARKLEVGLFAGLTLMAGAALLGGVESWWAWRHAGKTRPWEAASARAGEKAAASGLHRPAVDVAPPSHVPAALGSTRSRPYTPPPAAQAGSTSSAISDQKKVAGMTLAELVAAEEAAEAAAAGAGARG